MTLCEHLQKVTHEFDGPFACPFCGQKVEREE